jgi:methanogenic corrinoid protein MtbC1
MPRQRQTRGEPHGDRQLTRLIAALDEDAVLDMVRRRLAAGQDPLRIVQDCQKGMVQVGKKYEKREYYISGLIMAGEIMNQVGKLVWPVLCDKLSGNEHGRILLGTVEGDIHYIGKNLFKMLLECHGFTVSDAGEDVPSRIFLDKALEIKPHVVGLSCLLNTSFEFMRETVTLLKEQTPKLRPRPTLIIGGLVDEKVARYVGADHWAKDAMAGVSLCRRLVR